MFRATKKLRSCKDEQKSYLVLNTVHSRVSIAGSLDTPQHAWEIFGWHKHTHTQTQTHTHTLTPYSLPPNSQHTTVAFTAQRRV